MHASEKHIRRLSQSIVELVTKLTASCCMGAAHGAVHVALLASQGLAQSKWKSWYIAKL